MRVRVAAADFPDRPGVCVVYGDGERALYVGIAAAQSRLRCSRGRRTWLLRSTQRV
jgi:hypothetical protein